MPTPHGAVALAPRRWCAGCGGGGACPRPAALAARRGTHAGPAAPAAGAPPGCGPAAGCGPAPRSARPPRRGDTGESLPAVCRRGRRGGGGAGAALQRAASRRGLRAGRAAAGAPRGYPEVNLSRPMYWSVYAHPHPDGARFMPPAARPLPQPAPAEPCPGRWEAVVNVTKMHRPGSGEEPEGRWVRSAACPPQAVPPPLGRLAGDSAGRHGGLRPEDRERYARCLRGRTVVLVGNSVTRQWMFALLRLFTGRLVVRLKQKNQCGSACGLFLPGPVHVVYLHAISLWGKHAEWDTQGRHSGHALLGAAFGLRPDVIVVGLGHQDAFDAGDPSGPLRRLGCLLEHYAASTGARVYYRTASPLRRYHASGYFGDPAFIAKINSRLGKLNAEAAELFAGSRVGVLDEARLAAAALDRPEVVHAVYEDHIHTPSVATEMLRSFLHGLCPAAAPPS
eukprot:TRINITY_DN40760_c0_g1_i4.p1 TRINITY_DN40760_c0_g1~~TRINITY_DN40760_c0_g1_i4.p1  ORF type:complete len:486 (+),score=101.88 TRINITY_DN40760_c0_g1_i4:107-1459(+)